MVAIMEIGLFLRTELFVLIYIFFAFTFSLSLLIFAKNELAILVSVFAYGFLSMGWSIVPLIVTGDHYWFSLMPPPEMVSRTIVAGLTALLVVDAVKINYSPSKYVRNYTAVMIFALAISYLHGLIFVDDFERAKWLSFTVIVCFGGLMALYFQERIHVVVADLMRLSYAVMALLLISVFVGFMEISSPNPFIVNLYRGEIEVRGSSLFHNPNWWAVYVAPIAFYVSFLICAARRSEKMRASFLGGGVTAVLTLCLCLSGSRSVSALIICFMVLLLFGGLFLSCRRQVVALLGVFAIGTSAGVILGFLFSLAFGSNVVDKYILLLKRVFLWPIYVYSDPEAQQSIIGRMVSDGHSVVDSAWIFVMQGNPGLFVLLIIFVLWLVVRAAICFYLKNTFESLIVFLLSVYLVVVGFVGQVYWAFPVWVSIFIALGICLRYLSVMGQPDLVRSY